MIYKWIQKQVIKAVKDYLDRLPDEKLISVAVKIMGATGLTEETYKKLIQAASGDKEVKIFFGNGDYAVISTRDAAGKSGIGW